MTNPTQPSQQVPVAFEDEKINVLIAQHFPEPYYAIRAQNFARALLAQSAPAAIDVRDAALRQQVKNALCIEGHLNQALNMMLMSDSPDGNFNIISALAHRAVDMSFDALKSPPQTGKEVES